VLAVVFAAVAGLALYESVPRRVEVSVITKGVSTDGNSEDHYLITERGRVQMADTSQFIVPPPNEQRQKTTCLWSLGPNLHHYLHDCDVTPH
jgi:hypothetical protein